jgi:hypothetical protein
MRSLPALRSRTATRSFSGWFVASLLSSLLPVGACAHDDGAPSDACREYAPEEYVTTFEGEGFGAHEGRIIHAIVETERGLCRARGNAPIVEGRFTLHLTNRTRDDVYPGSAVFLDLDGDERCEAAADVAASYVGLLVRGQVQHVIAISDLSTSSETCARFSGARSRAPGQR